MAADEEQDGRRRRRRSRRRRPSSEPTPHVEELEPRILLSTFTLQDLEGAGEAEVVEQRLSSEDLEQLVGTGGSDGTEATAAQESRHELVFIDEAVEDYDQILSDLLGADGASREIEVVLLSSELDGISQVTQALATRSDLDAVHFIAHGSDGAVTLGDSTLDAETLDARRSEIKQWGDALDPEGDFLFYGCNLAEGVSGKALVSSLAELTETDIAASDDLSGHVLLSGDWDLEYRVGSVESTSAISQVIENEWVHLLASNLPPVNTVPGAQVTAQDTPLTLASGTGNALSVADPDAGTNEIEVTLSVDDGTLTLPSSIALGGEVLVNSTTGSTQLESDIAVAPDGSYVVVWRDSSGADGDVAGIFMQRFDASGAAVGSETLVNTTIANQQIRPAIAMDDAGNFVVVWQSWSQDRNNTYGVYAQRFDSGGNALGGEFLVNTTVNGDQSDAAVAMDSAGNFVVAWMGNGSGDADGIFVQRFDAAGNAVGSETRVNDLTTGEQADPAIALADDGSFVVVWDDTGGPVWARQFDAAGSPVAASFQVNTTTAATEFQRANVAMDASGNFTVIWDGDFRIWAQQYTAAGSPVGGEFHLDEGGGDPYLADIAMADDGSFVATWRNEHGDSNLAAVMVRQFDAAGAPLGGEFVGNETQLGNQMNPAIGLDGSGGFIISWDGQGAADSAGVYSRRFEVPALTFTDGDGNGDASMTFRGTVGDINLALDGLVYSPSAGFNGIDTLTIATDDLGNTGDGGPLQDQDTVQITVGNGNAPVVDVNGAAAGRDFATTWTEGGGDVVIVQAAATVTDPDADLAGITVRITNSLDGASEELLADVSGTGLIATWDQGTASLVIAGAGTTAEFEQVLRTVQYRNTSDNPDQTARIIAFTPSDGVGDGNTATTTLTIAAVNDPPANAVPGTQVTAEDTPLVLSTAAGNGVSVSDPDADPNEIEVTVSVGDGTLTLNTAGLVGEDTLVTSNPAFDQSLPEIAVNDDGSYVVVWSSFNQDGDQDGVYAQRFDVNGSPVGGEFRVNTTTTSYQGSPDIAADANGNFVVVWEAGGNQDGDLTGVFARLYDADGIPQTGEIQVNSFVTSNQSQPAVAMDDAGNFTVVWQDFSQDGSGAGIYGQRFDDTGAVQGPEFRVNTTIANAQVAPKIAMDADGDFVVVWTDTGGADGANSGVYGQRFNANGAPNGAEFLVNVTTASSQTAGGVAMDDAGNFVVTWQSSGNQDGSGAGIYARRYDAAGNPTVSERQVNTYTIGNQLSPTVEMNGSGEIVVAWRSAGQDGDLDGVYAQRLDSDLSRVGEEFRLNSYTAGNQNQVAIGLDAAGEIKAAWAGEGPGDAQGVFTRQVAAPELTWVAGDPLSDATITFRGTVDDVNVVLDGMVYTPNTGFNGTDTLTIATDDLGSTGSPGALQDADAFAIEVGNIDAPALDLDADDSSGTTGTGFALTWTEGSGPALVADADATLSVGAAQNVESMTVTITNLLDGTDEVLAADTTGTAIVASYDSATGVLTLSGTDTAENYQQVLRTVSYDNASDIPDPTPRSISITAADATSNGNTAVSTLAVAITNDPPTNTVPGDQSTAQDVDLVFSNLGGNAISITDAEAAAEAGEVELTLSVTQGSLTLNPFLAQDPASVQVNTATTGSEAGGSVGYAADGSHVIVWDSVDASGSGILFRLFDAEGTALGPETAVNITTTGDQSDATVAVAADGSFVVTWTSLGQDKNGTLGVYARRFAADGTALSGEIQVNTTTGGDQSNPEVVVTPDGGFAVVWEGAGPGDNTGGVFFQRFDASGNPVGVETRVNTETADTQWDPAIAVDGAGNFIVVWDSLNQDGSGRGIFGQRLDASGNPIGSEFQVNTTTAGAQWQPDVAADAAGNFLVVWKDQHVMGQWYDATGAAVGTEFEISTDISAFGNHHPSISMNSSGEAIVAWQKRESSVGPAPATRPAPGRLRWRARRRRDPRRLLERRHEPSGTSPSPSRATSSSCMRVTPGRPACSRAATTASMPPTSSVMAWPMRRSPCVEASTI